MLRFDFTQFSLLVSVLLFTTQFTLAQHNPAFNYQEGFDPHPHLTKYLNGETRLTANPAPTGMQKSSNGMTMLSYLPLPGHLISDVWAHGNYAYVGGWGPNTTLRVVDMSDPVNPSVAATLPPMGPGTSPQDVKAGKVNTPYFKGDLLVVGNDGFFGGVELYDIGDPANPVLLGSFPMIGTHNTFLYQKNNKAYVLLAASFREYGSVCCPDLAPTPGEFLVLDITDPANPTLVGEWAAGANGGFGFGAPWLPPFNCTDCRGVSPLVYLHDVWANEQGTVAYLSYWDLGLILLDISDPTNPTLISQTTEPQALGSDEGDCHVAVPAQGGNLVLVGDETFGTLPWGFLRIFDTSDPYNPVQISTYATPNTLTNPDPNLWTSLHNIIVRGSRAYTSWYNDGIRVIDFSNPYDPVEVASFQAPPGTTDPSLIWGVYVHKSYILASDISGGLFILKMNGSGPKSAPTAESTLSGNTGNSNLVAFPNPFRGETNVRFQLAEEAQVSLKVFDNSGKLVRILREGKLQASSYSFNWDGSDQAGRDLPDGIYVCRLEYGGSSEVAKLVLIR